MPEEVQFHDMTPTGAPLLKRCHPTERPTPGKTSATHGHGGARSLLVEGEKLTTVTAPLFEPPRHAGANSKVADSAPVVALRGVRVLAVLAGSA